MVTSNEPTPGIDAALNLLERYPDRPTLTLARLAYKQAPELWPTLDAARNCFRRLRGNAGPLMRERMADRGHRRPNAKAGELILPLLPDALTHFNSWAAVAIEGMKRGLLLADLHLPYYNRQALEAAVKHGKRRNPDTIILNGDVLDFYALSRWEKDPRKRDFIGERRAGLSFFAWLREQSPNARIIWKKGNHEERHEHYMILKAPELLGIDEFEIHALYHCDKYGIETIGEKRPLKMGKLYAIHGHEYRQGFAAPVNPARGYFLRAKTHCIGAHYHQTGQHSENTLEQKSITTFSQGCLCDLHPDYAPLNNWNHGFAEIELADDGAFELQNKRIINGKVY